jgi:hypothetical protein
MRVRLGAGLEEADLQRPLADRVVLTQELVHGGVLKQARSDECETPGKRSHGRGWADVCDRCYETGSVTLAGWIKSFRLSELCSSWSLTPPLSSAR